MKSKFLPIIEEYRSTKSAKRRSELANLLADNFYVAGDYEESLKYFQSYLGASESIGARKEMMVTHRRIGDCLLQLSRLDESLSHYQNYLKLAITSSNRVEEQRAYHTIGEAYFEKFENEERLSVKSRLLKLSELAYVKSYRVWESLEEIIDERERAEMMASNMLNRECERGHLIPQDVTISDPLIQLLSVEVDGYLRRLKRKGSGPDGLIDVERKNYDLGRKKLVRSYLEAKKFGLEIQLTAVLMLATVMMNLNNVVDALRLLKETKKMSLPEDGVVKVTEKRYELLIHDQQFRKAAKVMRSAARRNKSNRLHFMTSARSAVKIMTALRKITETQAFDEKAKQLELIGDFYAKHRLFKRAIDCYSEMLTCAQKCNADSLTATAHACLAVTNGDIREFEMAIFHAQKEVDIRSRGGAYDPDELAKTHLSIARFNFSMDRFKEALNWYEKAMDIIEQLQNVPLQVQCLKDQIACRELIGGDSIDILAELRSRHDNLTDYVDSELEDEAQEEEGESEEGEEDYDGIKVDDLSPNTSDSDDREEEDDNKEDGATVAGAEMRKGSRKTSVAARRNEKGETPLHRACIEGRLTVVKELVEQRGHPVFIEDHAGWTPLHEAANCGHLEIVMYLLDHGADIEHTGCPADGNTPLLSAGEGGNLDIVQYLITERGADVWYRNRSGANIMDLIDDCRERSMRNGTFDTEAALNYRSFIKMMQEFLGDRYVEFLRSRRGRRSQTESLSSRLNMTLASQKSQSAKSSDQAKLNEDDGRRRSSEHPTSNDNHNRSSMRTSLDADQKKASMRTSLDADQKKASMRTSLDADQKKASMRTSLDADQKKASVRTSLDADQKKASMRTSLDADQKKASMRTSLDADQKKASVRTSLDADQKKASMRTSLDADMFVDGEKERGVADYLKSLQMVGGSSSRLALSAEQVPDRCISGERGYVVGDDWLEEDMPGRKRRGRKRMSELLDHSRVRRHSSDEEEGKEQNAVKKSRRMDEVEKKSKDSAVEVTVEKENDAPIQESSDSVVSDAKFETSSIQSRYSADSSLSAFPRCVRLHFNDLSLLVPLRDRTRTVGWLLREFRTRLAAVTSGSVADVEDLVLRTTDGDLLTAEVDRLADVLPGNASGMAEVWVLVREEAAMRADDEEDDGQPRRPTVSIRGLRLSAVNVNALYGLSDQQTAQLDLSVNEINDAVMKEILRPLASWQHCLTHLNLSRNCLSGEAMEILADVSPPPTALLHFNISYNYLGNDSVSSITRLMTRWPKLREFDLTHCMMTEEATTSHVEEWKAAFHDSCVQEMHLSYNALENKGVDSLLRSMEGGCRIQSLYLRACIVYSDASSVATYLKHHLEQSAGSESVSPLIHLDFGANRLGVPSLDVMEALIHSPACRLRTLQLDGNRGLVSAERAATRLLEVCAETSVERLEIDAPPSREAKRVCDVLQMIMKEGENGQTSIARLMLRRCPFAKAIFSVVIRANEANRKCVFMCDKTKDNSVVLRRL